MKQLFLLGIFFLFCASHVHSQTNVFPSTGNVGVGTTAPESTLTVNPGAVSSTNLYGKDFYLGTLIKTVSGRSGFMALTVNDWLNQAGNNGHFVSAFPFNNSKASSDLTWKAFRLMTGADLQDKFWVNKLGDGFFDGKVGIGTTNPTDKLTVNGKIKAEEIECVVDVPADYVFEVDYELRSLEEIEDFISREGHLPDIPSAEVIIAEGWQVGEMSNKLLQKIEELTLYIIQQQKEIEELKARL